MGLNLFGRFRAPKKIALNDLAKAFWQGPQADTSTGKEPEKASDSEIIWENPTIQHFWIQYVRPYQNTIGKPVFHAIYSIIVEIEELEPCSSISESDEETPDQYKVLSGISLLDHTLNVCRETVDILKAKENDFQMIVGKTLIVALAHDIGKHPTAHVANMPHSFKSAMWLQKRIHELRDREQIIQAVRLHHRDPSTPDNRLLPILVQADRNARQKELADFSVEKQTKSMGDDLKNEEKSMFVETQNTDDSWFSKEIFFEKLKSQITCMGFDAFYYEGQGYFSASLVENTLNDMRSSKNIPHFKSRPECIQFILVQMPKLRNEKYNLKFKGNFKPKRMWFYVLEQSDLGSLEGVNTNTPRDREGRWLMALKRP